MPPATNSQAALANLQKFGSGMQSPAQMLDSARTSLGVQGAQERVSGLRGAIAQTTGLLNRVAPSVYGRTQNSLVTNAQADRMIANERQPIEKELGRESRDLDLASTDYNELNRQAESRAALEQAGQSGQLSFLQQVYQNMVAAEQAQRDEAYRQAALNEQRAARAASTAGLQSTIQRLMQELSTAKGAPSQAQVNAAEWLKQNGGPGTVTDYKTPAPNVGDHILGGLGTVANKTASGINNFLAAIPGVSNYVASNFNSLFGLR